MTGTSTQRREDLRRFLLERRHALQRQIDESLATYRIGEQRMTEESIGDTEDQAVRNHSGDQHLSLLEARNRTREQLDEALRRLEEGSYGRCQTCGSQIQEGRLKAIPFALRCRDCQEQAEIIEQIERREDRETT
jgi:DnaK suppressor protein